MMLDRLSRFLENGINIRLNELYESVDEHELSSRVPIVIFSDLHLGNGKKNDDFLKNSDLFTKALKEHYLPGNYRLVLNGDIEELQKFRPEDVFSAWKGLYTVFDEFEKRKALIKLVGNHDYRALTDENGSEYRKHSGIRLRIPGHENSIFIFHGHQASLYYRHFNALNTFLLRYIVNPVGIRNFSKKLKHRKKIRIERRVYNFSYQRRIISIIGHTHRPLFESLSKADALRFSIEKSLRRYRKAGKDRRPAIAEKISRLKQQYDKYSGQESRNEPASLLYSSGIPVPCLFNTGCAIGKRGITCIEIASGKISLVHWFDTRVSRRFMSRGRDRSEELSSSPSIRRVVLKEDRLDYILDSINLLAGSDGKGAENSSSVFHNFYQTSKEKLTIPCETVDAYGNQT